MAWVMACSPKFHVLEFDVGREVVMPSGQGLDQGDYIMEARLVTT